MNKRMLIAIALSLALWLGYALFIAPKFESKNPPAKDAAQTASVPAPEKKKESSSTVEGPAVGKIVPVAAKATKQESIRIRTKHYQIVLTNKGAAVESVKYGKRSIELAGAPVHGGKGILDFGVYFNDKELLTGNGLTDSLWSMKKLSDKSVQFETVADISGVPVILQKTYSFNDDVPAFDISYVIKNNGKTQIVFPENRVLVAPADSLGPKLNAEGSSSYDQLYSVYYADGSFEKGDRGGSMFSSATDMKNHTQKTNWFGIISRYFTVLMIPKENCAGVAWDSRAEGSYRIGGYMEVAPLASGSAVTHSFRVALAEKEKAVLSAIDPGIVTATDVSKWIEPLRDGIFWCLLKINMLFGNLGVAIVILSFITKFLFLPLTIKSTNSMKRMSMLQPEMAALKAKYKDKPEKLQKEIMELYKKHKVNPMSGCLPLLIQMPFFIALYSALSTSVDLWQSPFCLWIQDLSRPDTVFTIHGFNMNILPIIMTVTTYVQQKMSTVDTGQSGAQAMMMKLMPLLFIVFFWTMPSGLTLYWTIQNVLQIGHQFYVNKIKKTVPAEE